MARPAWTVRAKNNIEEVSSRVSVPSNVVFECKDLRSTYEELCGVEFSERPNERPWGMWAQFKDVDGNEFGLI
jgi:hypothetical protein